MHDLKIGTIRDLIAYRRKHDRMVEKKAEISFPAAGAATGAPASIFNKATGDETMALVKGTSIPTSRRWCACTRCRSSPTSSAK
jgi:3,4-dihydroxy 2-butanone 4-phosphate synthase/GTP cyclohydrolase II